MKKIFFVTFVLLSGTLAFAQSGTTEALQKKYDGSLSLYFYKNTLRMLNQTDNREFDEMIKNIEKMKFLMIDKSNKSFGSADYKNLIKGYKGETYEEVLTARADGRNIDVYIKDKKGSTLGTVILVNDSTSLYVLDILGSIDVSKASSLFSTIDQSSDIGQKIKSFLKKDEPGKVKKEQGLHVD
jgi:Domain of unknown function (DUF4252)